MNQKVMENLDGTLILWKTNPYKEKRNQLDVAKRTTTPKTTAWAGLNAEHNRNRKRRNSYINQDGIQILWKINRWNVKRRHPHPNCHPWHNHIHVVTVVLEVVRGVVVPNPSVAITEHRSLLPTLPVPEAHKKNSWDNGSAGGDAYMEAPPELPSELDQLHAMGDQKFGKGRSSNARKSRDREVSKSKSSASSRQSAKNAEKRRIGGGGGGRGDSFGADVDPFGGRSAASSRQPRRQQQEQQQQRQPEPQWKNAAIQDQIGRGQNDPFQAKPREHVNAAIRQSQQNSSRGQNDPFQAKPREHVNAAIRQNQQNSSRGQNDPFQAKPREHVNAAIRQSQQNSSRERGGGGGQERAFDGGKKPDPFASADPFGQGGGGPPMELKQCADCGRKFNPKSYEKHVKSCKKVFMTKRKAFDMKDSRVGEATKQQGGGSSYSSSSRNGGGRRGAGGRSNRRGKDDRKLPTAGTKKSGKWKQQSSALRDAMKQSRIVSQYEKEGRLHELPAMAPSAPDPSLVPCPHCGRSFNQKAADRHIPKCANTKAKPKRLVRGSGNYQGNAARQRSTTKRSTGGRFGR